MSDAGWLTSDCKSLRHLSLAGTRYDVGWPSSTTAKNLTLLHLAGTQVSDAGLEHFEGCKNLTHLYLSGTKVSDLSPLKGMKLTILTCDQTRVSDLSPLRGMPLEELQCDFEPERDAEVLRSIKTLETINGKPGKEFWKGVGGR